MKARKIKKQESGEHKGMDYVLELNSSNAYFTAKAFKELQGSINELLPFYATQSLPSQISKQDIADELEQALKRGSEDYANGYVEGLTDGFKQAITRTALPEGWISVEDRLPENGVDVLCYLKNGSCQVARYHIGRWFPAYNTLHSTKPTHWQSLPPTHEHPTIDNNQELK